MTNRTNNVDLENYVPNGEWELLETRLIRAKQFFPCCPEPYPYVTVTVKYVQCLPAGRAMSMV